jgi:hypothetical protein
MTSGPLWGAWEATRASRRAGFTTSPWRDGTAWTKEASGRIGNGPEFTLPALDRRALRQGVALARQAHTEHPRRELQRALPGYRALARRQQLRLTRRQVRLLEGAAGAHVGDPPAAPGPQLTGQNVDEAVDVNELGIDGAALGAGRNRRPHPKRSSRKSPTGTTCVAFTRSKRRGSGGV